MPQYCLGHSLKKKRENIKISCYHEIWMVKKCLAIFSTWIKVFCDFFTWRCVRQLLQKYYSKFRNNKKCQLKILTSNVKWLICWQRSSQWIPIWIYLCRSTLTLSTWERPNEIQLWNSHFTFLKLKTFFSAYLKRSQYPLTYRLVEPNEPAGFQLNTAVFCWFTPPIYNLRWNPLPESTMPFNFYQ